MACYVGTEMTESNLVLLFDAANPKSYSGSGNVIYNIVDTTSTGTMANGTVYTSNNAGSFSFSGSPTNGGPFIDYTINKNVPTNIATVEMVVKIKSFTGMMFGWTEMDVYLNSTRLAYNTSNSDQYGLSSATVTS